ncbi:histidine kinase [Kribbella sp. NBC_00709]|uniref:sensor histidine kinase n=1 Tax=Kribbella sp. NBC_00709 TaxID=2975972 RepID=UPI002E2E578A|nr:histidine kinase [Kribbella sp. NBC_00709]
MGRVLARLVTWPLAPALFAGQLAVSHRHGGQGITASDVVYPVAMLVCWAVGVFLTWRVIEQPAGWAFLGLGTALTWSGFTQISTDLALGPLIATFSDTSFVWWFVFLALALQFTPAVRPSSRILPVLTVVSGVVFQVSALLRSTPLDEPHDIVSPWAVAGIAGPISVLATVSVTVLGGCLLASVYVLVAAFRRARGEARQQLLWLVAGATPLAPCVVASFAASYAGLDEIAGWVLSVCVITLALGAALSVAKYRLYDVERIVTDSAAYAISTGSVIAVFAAVVVVITKSLPVRADAQLLTILATLAATGVARPAYTLARRVIDRRFNRRRFDAVQLVRAGLAQSPAPELGALLIAATGDPQVRALFPSEGGWVTSDGRIAVPGPHVVDVVRRGQVSARIEFDPSCCERTVVAAVVQEAAAEIDNLGLRAELAKQVEQITESRARLAGAHLEERRRMERDLHDGAQQRILAIALQLRSARVNGGVRVLRTEVDQAIGDLALTVQELRDLAAGLQPAALAGGGLRAATDELASRIPVRMKLDVIDQRFPGSVESAAWFVIAEAVSNAVKHARVDEVTIRVSAGLSQLHVAVLDDGVGGADPRGHGLQGLADRVAALGGALSAGDQPGGGTRVEAVLPCG